MFAYYFGMLCAMHFYYFWKLEFLGTKLLNLGKDWYYAGNLRSTISFPASNQAYRNYQAIGFLGNVLRGHDLYISESPSFVIQKNELKKKFFSVKQDISGIMPIRQFSTLPLTVFGKVFYDHGFAPGYDNYEGSRLLDNRYLYSIGAGLDVIFVYDLVMRFEFSRTTLNENTFFFNVGTVF